MIKMKSNKHGTALLFVFLVTLPSLSQVRESDTLFMSDEVLNLELRSDFTAIKADTAKEAVYLDGKLIYHSPDGKTKKFSVKVRARGDFRRNPETCNFPPLQVNFKKKEVKNTIFKGQDKLKLVTQCQKEEDVVEEFLIYKMYNQVTDLSLKVRLAKILYFDTSNDKELFESYSFFIEHEEDMAQRNNAVERDKFLTPFDLDRDNFMKMSVFEYLIGNKDWYISARRNVVILQPNDSTKKLLVVPYDFDFAALIDASYTKPRNVPANQLINRRIFKGICFTEEEFNRTFDFFRNLKPAFESIINNQELVSRATRKANINYLESSYAVFDDRELIQKEFLDVCETPRMYNITEE